MLRIRDKYLGIGWRVAARVAYCVTERTREDDLKAAEGRRSTWGTCGAADAGESDQSISRDSGS